MPAPALTLRRYTGADWAAVRDIHDRCKVDEIRGSIDSAAIVPFEQDPPTLVMFCRSDIVVATDSQEILGFTGTIGNYISWLCVHPTHRRRGVGTTLLRQTLAGIRGPATLNVFARNEPARRLYARIGFVVEHEFVGNFNGQPVDVVRLRFDAHPGGT
jgi:[ribosomal protein S18]-alanine N-acetyltransferase